MKIKTTQKEIKSKFRKIVCVGYCDLQYLLMYESPTYYTTRVEGWASDIYIFDDIAISTGYAPFGNIKIDYDILRKYDSKARKIIDNWDIEHDTKVKKVNKLIEEFLEEVKKV